MTKMKSNESGRTMLEMLGVLAIMGVIMYGAIAGISFGVEMYQINAAYHQIEELSEGIVDLYSWSRGYPDFGSDQFGALICRNDLTDCNRGDNTIRSAIGGAVITVSGRGQVFNDGANGFVIVYNGLSYLACSRLKAQTFRHVDCVPNAVDHGSEATKGSCNEAGDNYLHCVSR